MALGHVRIMLMVWSCEKPDTRLLLSESKARGENRVVQLSLVTHDTYRIQVSDEMVNLLWSW